MLRLPLCCLTGSLSAGLNLLHVTAKLTNFSKYVSTFHFIFYISYVVHRYFAISRISGSIKIMARIFGEIFFLSFTSFFAKQIGVLDDGSVKNTIRIRVIEYGGSNFR